MTPFKVTLETRSPLAISRNRAVGNQLETLRHIPGATWRGSVASWLIHELGLGASAQDNAVFHSLFLERAVRFGDLRLEHAKPTPLSARFCALHSEQHAARDLLVNATLGFRLLRECGEPMEEGPCGAKLTFKEEFYEIRHGRPEFRRIPSRIIAHTAIANSSLRVREAQFYSSEILERGLRFHGSLLATDIAAALVSKFLVRDEGRFITIGRGATRGQGHAILRLDPDTGPSQHGDIRGRLAQLNCLLNLPGEIAFTCTLLSPCLAFDRWLCSRPYLTVGDIEEAASEPGALDGYELRAWFSQCTSLSGWNAQAGVPKADISAIASGSAFAFVGSVLPENRDTEMDRLAAILDRASVGIGERWEEGFGEAVFCDEFHYRFRGN